MTLSWKHRQKEILTLSEGACKDVYGPGMRRIWPCRYLFFRTEEGQALSGKVAASLLSPSAFSFASDLAMLYEGGGEGLTWGHMWVDRYPLGAIMLMMTLDTALYTAAAWYFIASAGKSKTRLPWCCPSFSSCWDSCQAWARKQLHVSTVSNMGEFQHKEEPSAESMTTKLASDCVWIDGLSKVDVPHLLLNWQNDQFCLVKA